MWVYGRIVTSRIHKDRTIREKTSIEYEQQPVEFTTAGESERVLDRGVADYVGSDQASEKVDSSQPHGMIMVPKVARVLLIVIVVRFVGPRGSLVFKAVGEP